MPVHQFELIGGDAVLDFVNTIHDWTVPAPRDYLPTFPEALRFAETAGVISGAESRRIAALPAGMEVRRLRDLRARLERVLRAVQDQRSPSADDLEELASEAAEAARVARLRPGKGQLRRVIDSDAAGTATVRHRLVEGMVALLTSDRLARVSRCPSCGWFFLDTTKNRSRRWCSMAMCGSAVKARNYYWRTKRRSKRAG
jgi:predicted RNA-binding Zn ribbon-like protein